MKLEKTDRRKSSNRRGAATAISSNYDSLFVHRKNALYRRAAEMSAITDCSVGIILLSPEGELSQFSTAPMKKILRSYAKLCSEPHEIHTMESIQAKCIAAGGEGIGLRVDHRAGPDLVVGGGKQTYEHEHFREDTLRLSSGSQGKRGRRSTTNGTGSGLVAKGQEPWEEALEAIMRIGEVQNKRKLEVNGDVDSGADGAKIGRVDGSKPSGVKEEEEKEGEEEELEGCEEDDEEEDDEENYKARCAANE
jgi:hypothetical protein